MSIELKTAPKFQKEQMVRFIGGEGVVKNYYPHLSGWIYAVEMAMGPEPEIGRIGYETTVMLPEIDME